MKITFKDWKQLFRLNLYGTECPCCSPEKGYSPTAQFNILWDEKYHKTKYYVHCKKCYLTTPAFEDPKDAMDVWDYNFIMKEDEILLKEESQNG